VTGDVSAGGHLLQHVLAFVHLLRATGVKVSNGQTLDLARALDVVPITSRDDFRGAARSTLICRHEDLPLFDAAFSFYWRTGSEFDPSMLAIPLLRSKTRALRLPPRPRGGSDGDGTPRDEREERVGTTLTFSAVENLRHKDFGQFSHDEVQQCRALLRRMSWRIEPRRTRRRRPARRGSALDLRRMFRRNMRFGGEPLEIRRRAPRLRPRPLVVVCDISGSMDRYSRVLLQFCHAISAGMRHVEAFVFGTRLTRITRLLRHRDIDDAVSLVSKQVVDWSGGTRIGDAVKSFNFVWGRRVLGRSPVVLLISDGWDRGDPALLGGELARLQRSCHRLIWLNPLLGSPGYQPLTRGMQAALPHIDDFLPVHNLISLEQLAERLATLSATRPERRQTPAAGAAPLTRKALP
jgi:uncharacterized protein with von Willebrand factor type A (vWA) domain